ncbi:inner-membrane translocator [Fictibacillus macauensis ZFHKF-1]|uniref:Inner-membrane translocator n=1 Tax=Fictibacillus macauensis ZFHKF-1 TaxID=1196324 RepID=I8J237_9BACL|nr:ABC transporter permease [Fictibacillus macauensis]EIT85811.1 inner-membrane translocator [Fictibacillus macauensis ZFHKF-1]
MYAILSAMDLGVIFAMMAIGVYVSFRILDFPDLTVDGSFVTGGAVTTMMIVGGFNPFLATLAGLFAGFIAGCLTGILHTKGKINPLLSGILMMTALYSINLKIMDQSATVSVANEETILTSIRNAWEALGLDDLLNSFFTMLGFGDDLPETWSVLFVIGALALMMKGLCDWFLRTEIGLALRATGDNKRMISSLSANTDWLTILGLGLSNAFVALSGAIFAQYNVTADIGMGIGMIIVGLASVIIGEALFGTKSIARTTLAVFLGAIVYRIMITFALKIDIFDPGDLKLITAVIVIGALVIPKVVDRQKEKVRKTKRRKAAIAALQRKDDDVASTKLGL